jgi:hypothetical protein
MRERELAGKSLTRKISLPSNELYLDPYKAHQADITERGTDT